MCDVFDEMQPSEGRTEPAVSGVDRLDGVTDTPVVSQRSESGQGILTVKTGRGKYVELYDVVSKSVMSFMSVDCSLTVLRNTPSCLAITSTFRYT